MQQVAIAKSEIAAIATSIGSEPSGESTHGNDFEQALLKHQNSKVVDSQPTDKVVPKKTESTVETTQSSNTSDHKLEPSNDTIQSKEPVVEEKTIQPASVDSSAVSTEAEEIDLPKNENVSSNKNLAINYSLDEIKQSNDTLINSSEAVINKGDVIEENVANEWVTLVNNLQKLAKQADPESQIQKQEGTDQSITSFDEQITDSSTQMADSVLLQQTDTKLIDTKQTPFENHKVEKLVEALLTEITNAKDNAELLPEGTNQAKVEAQSIAKVLVEQPELLQDILTASSEVVIPGKSDLNSKTENESVDLVTEENKQLLGLLLNTTEPEDTESFSDIEAQHPIISDVEDIENNKLTTGQESVSSSTTKLQLANGPDNVLVENNDKLDISTEQVEQQIIEQTESLIKVPATPSTISTIASLPEKELHKVVTNIAEQLLGKESNIEAVVKQAIGNTTNNELLEAATVAPSAIKEFVVSLKAGLAEYKNQLSQGREPGIDLKSLVNESLTKVVSTLPNAAVTEESAQIIGNLAQIVDVAVSVNRAIEQHQSQISSFTYNAAARDVAQIQGEQSKQLQMTQAETKFEKTVNISKPEGVVQLAEKVRWMANTKNLVAEIRLDPAELGSVHVKVAMTGESASINFVVQSQQARDAMETATPRLREMLAEKGIELGQSSVRQENGGQGQDKQENLAGKGDVKSAVAEEQNVESVVVEQKVINGALGGIDYFA